MKSFHIKPLSIIIISCLGIFAYSNTFFCPFHFDDNLYIINNLGIRNIQNLLNIWGLCPCRVITFLSLAVNYHFHRLNVFGYHLFNITVHLGSAMLVWWLTLLTLSTPAMKEERIARHANIISLFAGLIFVSHPVQTEAVTYIWQRAASMAAFFYLASLCFYIKSRLLQDTKKFYYICSLIAAVVAMFTKENAITLPLIILFYEFSFLKTRKNLNWKPLIPFFLTLFIIPVTMLLTKSERFQEIQDVVKGPGGTSPMHYFLTQFRVMVTYIRLAFLPLNQNLDYDYPIFKNIFELPVLASFLFLMVIFVSAKRLFLKYRLVSFSIFWFFLTLLPESSFLPLEDVIFEHRLYLPLVGYSMFLVSSVYYLWGKNTLKTMVIVLTMIIAFYSVLTYQRNKVWKEDITLWNDAVQKSPHKARTYNDRGLVYYRQGNFVQAISDYNKAIEINPDYAEAYNNRGIGFYNQGNFSQAISDYNKAIKINPDYVIAHYNRGNSYAQQGGFTQAISDYKKAIEIDHDFAVVYNNRGDIYYGEGNFTQALSDYSKAIEINPDYAEVYSNRAMSYYYLKEYDKARADVHKAEGLGYAVNPEFLNALKYATNHK